MRDKFSLSLNERSLKIFEHIVDAYVETGEPIGSKVLSQRLGMHLSSATIRNVMARLEEAGLLYSPHTSAGRLPTDIGLRFFVEGVLEVGDIDKKQQQAIEKEYGQQDMGTEQILQYATMSLSGLTQCAGLVIAPKNEMTLKHLEFIRLDQDRALVVLVTNEGDIENRVITLPKDLPSSTLTEASNYVNDRLAGKSLKEAKRSLAKELNLLNEELNEATTKIIEEGVAHWSSNEDEASLIIHGQSHLLENVQQMEELARIKKIFTLLDTKECFLDLMDAVIDGDGIQIFIGAENDLFQLSGCSMIISPFKNVSGQVIGSLGVIGPMRMNYRRIIPMVDYTAKLLSKRIR